MNENELVERAASGDEKAFEELVRRYQGRVRAYFALRLEDASMVDDLAQEVFVVMYTSLSRYEPSRGGVWRWLKGIARNVLRNELRKHRPVPVEIAESARPLFEAEAESLEEMAHRRDLIEVLMRCVERLKGKAKEVLRLYYFEHMSLEEVSSKVGRSAKNCSVMLVRIRRVLYECVEGELAARRKEGEC